MFKLVLISKLQPKLKLVLRPCQRLVKRPSFSLGSAAYSAIIAGSLNAAAVTLAASQPSAAELDLKTAEKLVLNRAPALHSAATQIGIAELGSAGHLASLLPSLSLRSSHSTPRNQDSPSVRADLSLSQEIANPLVWRSTANVLQSQEQLASVQLNDKRQQVQRDVRLQYFAVSYCEGKKTLQRESLTLIDELTSIARQRYATGFIDESDLLRSRLQFDEQHANLQATELSCRTETQKLASLIAWDLPELKLTTPLHLALDTAPWTQSALLALQREQHSLALREAGLYDTIATQQLQVAYHQTWSPKLELAVSYPLAPREARRQPSFTASLNWELFAGGRDYISYRSSVLEQADKGFRYAQAQQDYEQLSTSLIAELMALKGRWHLQNKAAEAWSKLAKQSKQRFRQGLVSSREVNEDLATLLQQQEKKLEIMHELSGKLIILSYELRKPDLLYQAIK